MSCLQNASSVGRTSMSSWLHLRQSYLNVANEISCKSSCCIHQNIWSITQERLYFYEIFGKNILYKAPNLKWQNKRACTGFSYPDRKSFLFDFTETLQGMFKYPHQNQTLCLRFRTDSCPSLNWVCMMTPSSNGNIFRVTGPLCGEFPGPRRIPRTKASDAELGYFLWTPPE